MHSAPTPDLRLDFEAGRAHFLTDAGAAFYRSRSGLQIPLCAGQYAAALSTADLERLQLAALAAGLCVSAPVTWSRAHA